MSLSYQIRLPETNWNDNLMRALINLTYSDSSEVSSYASDEWTTTVDEFFNVHAQEKEL